MTAEFLNDEHARCQGYLACRLKVLTNDLPARTAIQGTKINSS